MRFWDDERAQGSIEMLVLVAGAILIAAIVGAVLKRAATETAATANP